MCAGLDGPGADYREDVNPGYEEDLTTFGDFYSPVVETAEESYLRQENARLRDENARLRRSWNRGSRDAGG